jgi:hypothetical protein
MKGVLISPISGLKKIDNLESKIQCGFGEEAVDFFLQIL